MSAWALHKYTEHLAGNRQKTERYEIALWKKLFYPLAALVMMALALPFAYMQARAGMVGVKVFLGIMLGIFFHMLNSLFSHIGLLQNWPPLSAAVVPSARLPRRGDPHDVVGRAALALLNSSRRRCAGRSGCAGFSACGWRADILRSATSRASTRRWLPCCVAWSECVTERQTHARSRWNRTARVLASMEASEYRPQSSLR